MERVTIHLGERLLERARELAAERGVSLASSAS
jgi:hypothetical protein